MNVRISNISKAYDAYAVNKAAASRKSVQAKQKKDQVNISNEGKDYQIAAKILKESPDVREDKIKDIKARMEAGTYNVSSSDIADKLLRDAE